MSSSPKTIGVIGLGSIGMRHARNLLAMGHKVYGYDISTPAQLGFWDVGGIIWPGLRTKDFANFDGDRIYGDIDGIVVTSPTSNHISGLRYGAIRGWPTFVEKPLSDKIDDLLIDGMRRMDGLPLMVGNNLRFHSCVKWAKGKLRSGELGKLLWASFWVAQKNTKYTDPVVLNWGAHEFDLALYLLGPATVTAATGDDKIFDTCLLHEYGVPSTIHCDYVTQPERREFFIAGTEGTLHVDLVNRITTVPGVCEHCGHGGSFDQDYKDEMQAFIDLIDGKPVPHAATGEDGLHALELILEAKRMAEK